MKEYEVYLINDDGSPMLQKDGSPFEDFSIKAESPKLAYEAFVKSIKPLPSAKIGVSWGFMGHEHFEPPHLEDRQDPSESNQNEAKQQVNQATSGAVSSDNSQSVLLKLDEIHSTMKAIRWTIAGGFLFIILVISGIIKPGIFG
jgi:hypothetical protein